MLACLLACRRGVRGAQVDDDGEPMVGRVVALLGSEDGRAVSRVLRRQRGLCRRRRLHDARASVLLAALQPRRDATQRAQHVRSQPVPPHTALSSQHPRTQRYKQ